MADQDPSVNTPAPEGEEGNQPDPINNLKAEFNRKLENSNAQLLAAIESLKKSQTPAPAPTPSKKVSDMIYEDPDAAAEMITSQTEERIMKRLDAQQVLNSTVQALYSDYPELSDKDSELTKRTMDHISRYPQQQQKDPTILKLAARDAAAELGVMPKNKRGNSNDDFSFGGSSSSKGSSGSRTPKTNPEDDMILQTAAVFGLDVSDPKKKDRVLGRKRDEREWLQYRPSTTKKK